MAKDGKPDARKLARWWLEADPDEQTSAQLEALLNRVESNSDDSELEALFTGRLAFGTAGLRASMGVGPNRMNRLVVMQTTAGLMAWLGAGSLVVIGFDGRHNSQVFANDVAEVVAGCGGRPLLLAEAVPTPVLAHAAIARKADAGVIITASHNPASDNGYKLYLSDGIQLASPDDKEIAGFVNEVANSMILPAVGATDPPSVALTSEISRAHIEAAVETLLTNCRDVKLAYTPLHGVAGRHLLEAFELAGFPKPMVVNEQFDPDPNFPTVKFPNPEELGVMDAGIALAQEHFCDAVFANDPDGDRLAVAIPDRCGSKWVRLSGDQVGCLIAEHVLANTNISTPEAGRLVVSSIVSSRLIDKIAAAHSAVSERTLTGFKWVARPIVARPDMNYVFGYEEALGYCVGARVRDKDGISAALVMAEILAECKARGETLWNQLDGLDRRHGVYRTDQLAVRFLGQNAAANSAEVVNRLLANPPAELSGLQLVSFEDLSVGNGLPPTTGLVLNYEQQTRIVIRPSGTEAMLKAYIEVVEPVSASVNPAASASLGDVQRVGETRLSRLKVDLLVILR